MSKPTKLELTWIGKERWPKLERCILLEDSEKSPHAPPRVIDHDRLDNGLTFGGSWLTFEAVPVSVAVSNSDLTAMQHRC